MPSEEYHIPIEAVSVKGTRSALELVSITLGILLALASAVGTYNVLKYRVDQLDESRKEWQNKTDTIHSQFDSRIQSLEDSQHNWETTYDHRLTVVESQNTEILDRLQRIEDKLDKRR